MKLSVIVLCIAGFSVNLLGTLVWIFYGFTYAVEREGILKFRYEDALTWDPHYSPIVLDAKALFADYVPQVVRGEWIHTPFLEQH